MAIADHDDSDTDIVRRPAFDRAMVFGIFTSCLVFWAVVIVALVRFF